MEKSIKDILEQCNQEIANTDNALEKREKIEKVKDLWRRYDGDDRMVWVEEYLKVMADQKGAKGFVANSRIPKLDEITDGFRSGNLVVVSGSTKQGKTSFCQTLTENFSADGIKCAWFTYEVPVEDFVEKFREMPQFVLPMALAGNTTEWIEKRVVEAKAKYGVEVFFIDHLHYIVDLAALKQNLSVQIGFVMRELKKIALRWGVIIFLVAHVKKTKTDSIPDIDDMRDSSFVAQEADTVIMVYRLLDDDKQFTNMAGISVVANRRNGKMGSVKLLYRDNKFSEVVQGYDDEF